MSPQSYITIGSYDWDDFHIVFPSRTLMLEWVQEAFNIDENITLDSPEFWQAQADAYENGKWKSFQILQVDWDTRDIIEWKPT